MEESGGGCGGGGGGAVVAAAGVAAAAAAVDPTMEWQCMTDPATGDAYYWNTKTGQVQWEMPDAEPDDDDEVTEEEEADK